MAVPSAQASTNVKVGSITSWIPAMNDCKAIKHIVMIIIELRIAAAHMNNSHP
jgi:hypothetical protein